MHSLIPEWPPIYIWGSWQELGPYYSEVMCHSLYLHYSPSQPAVLIRNDFMLEVTAWQQEDLSHQQQLGALGEKYLATKSLLSKRVIPEYKCYLTRALFLHIHGPHSQPLKNIGNTSKASTSKMRRLDDYYRSGLKTWTKMWTNILWLFPTIRHVEYIV